MHFFKRIIAEQTGATAIEYGLIAALIAVAAIVAMGGLGNQLANNYNMVSSAENNANATAA